MVKTTKTNDAMSGKPVRKSTIADTVTVGMTTAAKPSWDQSRSNERCGRPSSDAFVGRGKVASPSRGVLAVIGVLVASFCYSQDTIRLGSLGLVDVDTVFAHEIYSEYDTTYLCSVGFIHAYQTCRTEFFKAIEGLDNAQGLLDSLEAHSNDVSQALRDLQAEHERTLRETATRLTELQGLNEAQGVENAKLSESLTRLEKQLKAERWRAFGRKIVWGAGGVGVGILVTLILNQ